jgi:hypothetical protein
MIIVFWFQISIVFRIRTRLFFGEKKNPDGTININGGYANSSVELAPGIFLVIFQVQNLQLWFCTTCSTYRN